LEAINPGLYNQIRIPGLYILICNGMTLSIYQQECGPYIVLNSHSPTAYAKPFESREDALNHFLQKVNYKAIEEAGEFCQIDVIEIRKNNLPKVTLSNTASGGGGAPRSSPWIEHVKAYAKRHKLTYKDALSRASPSYKSRKKAKKA